MHVHLADTWRTTYPGASVGILLMDRVENPPDCPALASYVHDLEHELRERWAGATRADLTRLPELEAYRSYYRRFGKTYHVQLQLESVALKGKPLRSNGSLVLAMFAAELRNRLLTAGHDRASVEGDIAVAVATGGEPYVGIGGRSLMLHEGDMYVRDDMSVLSSVIDGPDDRTQITPTTRQVVFCVYAPAGIQPDAVERHLDDLAGNARLIAPDATVVQQQVFEARA
jgi:DNA/RNA-binding domain of Phe-tRNA-synthetase-like protein